MFFIIFALLNKLSYTKTYSDFRDSICRRYPFPFFLQGACFHHSEHTFSQSSTTSFRGLLQSWLWHTQQQQCVIKSNERAIAPIEPLNVTLYVTPYRQVTSFVFFISVRF